MKIGLVFMTVLAMVTTLVAGCAVSFPSPTSGPTAQPPGATIPGVSPAVATGTIKVLVTDAPPRDEVTGVEVKVSSVEVHKAVAEQEGSDEEDGWISVNITGTNPFDLIEIKDVVEILGSANVSVGKYTQIRMTIEYAQVTLADDSTPETILPSGKLKFVRPFEVVEGQETELLIDFDADKSVVITGEGKAIVKPVVKLLVGGAEEDLEIITDSLPNGRVNDDYTATLEATGGTQPYAWSISDGDLPDGLELDDETGEISGTPTEEGDFKFTVKVEDSSDPMQNDTQKLSISIAEADALVIETTSLPDGEKNADYSETLQVIDGTGPYTWSITNGKLPDGLELDEETGEISGIPTKKGNFNFTVKVEDSSDPMQSDTQKLSIRIED